ncbi:hypothetical protein Patl1_32068 [Pistacia atlantica]|uniref:Uncharacterized protein n=1 Tax=Pistacia atlantica TaxID=434234 RepID=A0ACC1AMR3_9ROSI|nr:hypothetical protein Patl1_32068 [Pistacia atlantica]
MPHFRFFGSL